MAACSVTGGTEVAPDGSTFDPASSIDGADARPGLAAPTNFPDARSVSSDGDLEYGFRRLSMTAGGFVTGLVISPTTPDVMFARTDVGGAYRWDRADGRWYQLLTTLSVAAEDQSAAMYSVDSIASAPSDPEVVYLAVGSDSLPPVGEGATENGTGRIMSSVDGGRTWRVGTDSFIIAGNAAFRPQGEVLAVDPFRADVVVLGTRREGLWRSDDGGQSFTASSAGGQNDLVGTEGVTFVTADPSAGTTADGSAARWYAGVAGVGVVQSEDAGATWTPIETVGSDVVPRGGTVVDGTLYVSFDRPEGGEASLARYDGGAWDTVPAPKAAPLWTLAVDPTDPTRMVAATEAVRSGSVFFTEDGGDSWASPNVTTNASLAPWIARSNVGDYMPIGRLVFDPHRPGSLWFAEGIGVWTADPNAGRLDWTFAGHGVEELLVTDFVTPEQGGVVSAVADFQGFRHEQIDSIPEHALVDDSFAGGTDLASVGGRPDELVWIGAEYHLYFTDRRRPRAARSLDGGRSWTDLPNLVPEMFGGNVAVAAGDADNIVWVPSYYLSPDEYQESPKGIFVTSNGGRNWTNLPEVGGTNRFHRLMWWFGRTAVAADQFLPATFYLFDDEEHFFVSVDGGETWGQAPFAPPCREDGDCHVVGELHADPGVAGRVWAAVGSNGLYRSDDAGESPWTRIDGVDEVRAVGFGAAMEDDQPDTIYLYGRVGDDQDLGLWRSDDGADTFDLIARRPFDLFGDVITVNGDRNVPGRVYVGYAGLGAVVGDPES